MIIFRKKHFGLICFFLTLSFLTCTHRVSSENRTFDATQVTAPPSNSKVIIVDAGHRSEKMVGAVSNTGIKEADINLQIALKVQKLLEQNGATVLLTRSDENAMYEINSKTLREKKIDDSKNRAKLGNTSSADIFVSIHVNKISETKYSGWQTFYKKSQENR